MQQRNRNKLNYHLKKTEPFKNHLKRTVTTQMKMYQRNQKVSAITKKNILTYIKKQDEFINQQHINDNITNAASRINICRTQPRPNIFQRSNSQSKIKKLQIAQKGKSLKYWKVENTQPKFVVTLKSLISQMMANQQGCKCSTECQVRQMLIKWLDIPVDLLRNNYSQLLQKVKRVSDMNSKQLDTEWSEFQQQQNQRVSKQRQKLFKQINKDIARTQSSSPAFQNPQTQSKVQRILKCYAIEDPEIGYVQGMNMVMSGLLYHVRDQATTYALTRKLFHNIRNIYFDGFTYCYAHINEITHLIAENICDLYQHFQQLSVQLRILLFPWIISLLSVIVPLDSLHLVYQGFIKHDGWNFIYRMILSIFIYYKRRLKLMDEASDILVFLSATNTDKGVSDWSDIYQYALTIKI